MRFTHDAMVWFFYGVSLDLYNLIYIVKKPNFEFISEFWWRKIIYLYSFPPNLYFLYNASEYLNNIKSVHNKNREICTGADPEKDSKRWGLGVRRKCLENCINVLNI